MAIPEHSKPGKNYFDQDTSLESVGANRFEANLNGRWWITVGPNGGYLAAILLRAMADAVGDAERSPRSLTVHYTTRAEEGPASIETHIERTGRSLTTVSARMNQGERLIALALGAFSRPRVSGEFQDARMPEVLPLEEGVVLPEFGGAAIPIHERYDVRWAVPERPWSAATRARSGAWIRLQEPRIVDPLVVAALADALTPAVFSRSERHEAPLYLPTVDLTVHFRVQLPLTGAVPGDFSLAVFGTRMLRDGFLEEDGEIWSKDGVLLAHSRQLALLVRL